VPDMTTSESNESSASSASSASSESSAVPEAHGAARPARHPLDMLDEGEVRAAVALLRADPRVPDGSRFAYVALHEPDKDRLAAWVPGDPVDREVRATIVPGPRADVLEATVSVTHGEVRSLVEIPDVRPGLLMSEAIEVIFAVKDDPAWQAAMRRRGIDDFDLVQLDPWPAGCYGIAHETGRRITRVLSYQRLDPQDNGYGHPIEGVIVFVDMGTKEILEVLDLDADREPVPVPAARQSYYPEHVAPSTRPELKRLEITQPDGPSFTVDGNHIRWQHWDLRITFDAWEGLVLHQVAYDDGGRRRTVLHRASITEMVVPYGSNHPAHFWKNAFDTGEWGLGRMTAPLTLGCDCLGEIFYFDAVLANEEGEPYVTQNAICMHEEDYGILWKHVDLHSGRGEVRRSRRLVISHIATVGNYEYGFFWYLYLDGNIQLEVKLTGIVQTQGVRPGEEAAYANLVAPGIAAPHHQHLFSARLDFDVDGPTNRVYEVDAVPEPAGDANPYGNAFRADVTLLDSELAARRVVDPGRSRTWRIVNPEVTNSLGQPVAYKLIPTMSTPTMLASAESSVGRRAGFAHHNLWVTPYAPDERRAAGEYPNQHAGGDGLPRWTAADRPLVDTDVVVWYTFGVTHLVRPEDFPVMPVEYTGFLLTPYGFFDRNPALDVPPPDPDHCRS
jgi:primary-amine oxidase